MQVPVFMHGFGSHWLSTAGFVAKLLVVVVVVVVATAALVVRATLAGQLFGLKKPSGQ